ncbi:hypothetical protein IWQ60_004665 [Tieghemiomyces parasiticus]|uniref:Ubiquitin-like domain-containing protein n=1 Tax=Tieghemiomyces parasiticus TaxID=78921 RepID=A0A9W8DYY5_9FUNG|nr:hypothetical protein IWQ60_004665 [Tieghemiomyces parasiticus]
MSYPEILVRLPLVDGNQGYPDRTHRTVCLDAAALPIGPGTPVTIATLKAFLTERYGIPIAQQRLTTDGGLRLADDYPFLATHGHVAAPWSCQLQLAVRGGKGGFGSMLRARGAMMASKKATDQDACRNLDGHRLRSAKAVDAAIKKMDQADELARKRKEKLHKRIQRGLQEPVEREHRFEDGQFFKDTEKMAAKAKQAVHKAVRAQTTAQTVAASSCSNGGRPSESRHASSSGASSPGSSSTSSPPADLQASKTATTLVDLALWDNISDLSDGSDSDTTEAS